ncbi:MAG: hypothetical protein IKO06_05795 [Alphaproteobacteria bacterium]|nr:hypothetical protein [Alphaproteobacteria bacterium]
MKKIFLWLFLTFFLSNNSFAMNMVKKENYLRYDLTITGLPDYPPFSYYELGGREKDIYFLHGAFLKPTKDVMEKYGFAIENVRLKGVNNPKLDVKMMLLDVKSGNINLYVGAYANTRIFSGLEMIFPAALSNPIHVITLPETQDKINTTGDLKKLRGVVCKKEYFSDFVLRKMKELNVKFVNEPFEAYEMLFTGEADYLLGSLYYNRMMSSKQGIERYLGYSKKPLFKMPMFIAISKVTPMFSEYMRVFKDEFAKPEYAIAVKKEIIRIVEEEVRKNNGIVPPTFAKKVLQAPVAKIVKQEEIEQTPEADGYIVQKKEKAKTFDDVLDGI